MKGDLPTVSMSRTFGQEGDGVVEEVGRTKPGVSVGVSESRRSRPGGAGRAWRASALVILLAGASVLGPSGSYASDRVKLPEPNAEQRLDYIRRARVWEPSDVSAKDLYRGPAGRLAFAVDDEVSCEFVPKPMSGWTPKFSCRLEDGTIVKVKYEEGGRYKEVFGEVLGTRLFWALGFYADRMLPVHMTCHGCPEHPFEFVDQRKKLKLNDKGEIASFPPDARLGTYRFDLATVEERVDSDVIETKDKQGWSWKLLDRVDEKLGGASRAEIDAFKLLNAFVQNADNKAIQNKLVCPRAALEVDDAGGVTCRRPVMFVADLGSVFGNGGFTTGNSGRVDYEGWKARRVWRDRGSCKARLASIGGIFRSSTLRDPVISEEGRALLSEQLKKLSDAQIADLFRAARIERLHQKIKDGDHGEREVTIADWVDLFKQKRSEITEHPGCKPR
jgi:hypothetical protein